MSTVEDAGQFTIRCLSCNTIHDFAAPCEDELKALIAAKFDEEDANDTAAFERMRSNLLAALSPVATKTGELLPHITRQT